MTSAKRCNGKLLVCAGAIVVGLVCLVAILLIRTTPQEQPPSPVGPAVKPQAPKADAGRTRVGTATGIEDVGFSLSEETLAELDEDMTPGQSERKISVDLLKQATYRDPRDSERIRETVWAEQDEVYAAMPKYGEVKERILAKAGALLSGIDATDEDAVAKLAQRQLDEFWEKGSLGRQEAYENGWLARGVLELALEKDPKNFRLLSLLKEAVASTTLIRVGGEPNRDSYLEIWPILEKQEEIVRAGEVPLSPDAMLAMWDWTWNVGIATGNREAAIEGWQWMVENADACGWGKLKGLLERALASARRGRVAGPCNLYMLGLEGFDSYADWVRTSAEHARRPCEIRGSEAHGEAISFLWEVADDPLVKIGWNP